MHDGPEKAAPQTLEEVLDALDPWLDYPSHHKLSRQLKKFPLGQAGLKPVRVALLATSTVDHFRDVLRLYLTREGFDADIHQCEYDTIFQTGLDPASDLYRFNPDVVWIFTNHRDCGLPQGRDDVELAAMDAVARLSTLWQAIQNNSTAHIIQNNADFPLESVFGNYAVQYAKSPLNFLRRFNLELAAAVPRGVSVLDMESLSAIFGRCRWHDERYWYHSKNAFALDAAGLVAHAAARLVGAFKGLARKCLVLDLDNTLWGGVIGDDGIGGIALGEGSAEGEAFLAFQRYCKDLGSRGVILAVCSKNDIDIATDAIVNHPDMVLRLDDFAHIVCNWSNKADNIRAIAQTLEIGLDSIVFVDDNPAERALVRAELPMVAVPELPGDPALYVRTVDEARYFETIALSAEDWTRGSMYRGNAKRRELQGQFTDLDTYLRDLDMVAERGRLDAQHLPRAAQLINKSNQFHLTTTRYTEAEIKAMDAAADGEGWWFKLADRFGDNGLISVIILRAQEDVLTVDTWVMSCRVLARGMEEFIHNHMLEVARRRGLTTIAGLYIPTKRNKLVEKLFDRLGWTPAEAQGETRRWTLDVTTAAEKSTHIRLGTS